MQLPYSADVLVALGVGVIALIGAVVAAFVVAHRRRGGRTTRPAGPAAADPAALGRSDRQSVPGGARPRDTTAAVAHPRPAEAGVRPADPDVPGTPAGPGCVPLATTPAETISGARPPVAPGAEAEPPAPVFGAAGVIAPWLRVEATTVAGEVRPATGPGRATARPASASVGSSGALAGAVAKALAARAAAGRPHPLGEPAWGEPASRDPAAQPPAASGPRPDRTYQPRPAARGDARDRLLAVLLADPVRAVGAVSELESARGRLDDAVRHEQAVLGTVLQRLAEAGLQGDQIAALAGLDPDEVRRSLVERADAG